MHCEEVQELLDAYIDRELDVIHDTAIETHLQQCPGCMVQHDDLLALRSVLRSRGAYFEPPASLERRVQTLLRRATRRTGRWTGQWMSWAGLAAAAIVIVGFIAISMSEFVFQKPSSTALAENLTQDIVAMHIRSLMVDHLTDLASTEPHVMKPWFSDKLGFAPPAVDLTSQQFPFVGARLDYVNGQPVAAVIYRRRGHVINLIIAPAASWPHQAPVTALMRRGYQLHHWTHADLAYWAISDLNQSELGVFAQLVQSGIQP